MELSIIIINWHSKDFLRACLKSLDRGAAGLSCEVLVIDNASHDGCAAMLAAEFPAVRFIQSDRNLGFSGGNNRAARQAQGEFLLFLNPDTVVEGNALVELVETLRRLPGAGAVGARLLNTDRSLQTSCVQSFPTVLNQVLDCEWLRSRFPRSRLWGMAPLFADSPEPAPIDAISGACFMIRRELFNRVKGFDECYFMYSEDIDLSYKVKQAGFKCYYVPTAILIHHGGGSSQKERSSFSNVMTRESVYRFLRRHRGWFVASCFRFSMGFSALARLPAALILSLYHKKAGFGAQPSVHKWLSIFRWSLGMETWTAKR